MHSGNLKVTVIDVKKMFVHCVFEDSAISVNEMVLRDLARASNTLASRPLWRKSIRAGLKTNQYFSLVSKIQNFFNKESILGMLT